MSNREQFIAKMRADGCPDTWTFQDDGTGGFHNHATEWAWIAWNRAIESQATQIATLKTVMIAAAEEIAAHWQAHCDAEGYGPQNLLRRLEEGIPSEYGYTAGAFAALTAELELRRKSGSASDRLHNLCEGISRDADGSEWSREEWERLDAEMAELKAANEAWRKALRRAEVSHTGMSYGDEKRGDITSYTRGWGDCMSIFKDALAARTQAHKEPT